MGIGNIGGTGRLGIIPNTGVRYSAEASALFARMTTQPDATRKKLIDTTIVALKSGGIWAKLDALWLLAAADAQSARLNWITTSYPIGLVSSPVFTTDRGYATDGSSSYLTTGFIPSAASAPKFALGSAHIGFWSRTSAAGAVVDMGAQQTILCARGGDNKAAQRVNCDTTTAVVVASGAGHWLASRTSTTLASSNGYQNGVAIPLVPAIGNVSTSLEAIEFLIGKRGGSAIFSARQFACAHIGAGMTTTDAASFYSIINTYMTAVGAA